VRSPARLSVAIAIALGTIGPTALSAARTVDSPSGTGEYRNASRFGHSARGRELRVKRIGYVNSRVKVLVMGVIHGDEPSGRAIVRRLRHRRAPNDVALYLVDALNPDGLARHTRQNARGVDLNRNFAWRWRREGSRGSTYYSGPRPFSEPESRAAKRLVARVRPDITVWYHEHMCLVDKSKGADPRIVRRYAHLVGLPARRIRGLHGIATGWQNRRFGNSNAFVVELCGGRLAASAVRAHADAIVRIAESGTNRR
jgi:protein MpaA